jgi:hypothetical protein
MRGAIDMVIQSLGDKAPPRAEVVTAIAPLVETHSGGPAALATLVLEKMGLSHVALVDSGETAA